ncbi:TetR/AcrR family transcriptional regulator [Leifsonia poae]|uniref:TetR/AcrR family transcriptional regulator n=1 Tax=Leifsonia poae TaxID=110933 RepID=UPI003D664600
MARPRSDERRTAILAAATRVIATRGLGAATAAIAKEAGVSNGSLFLYFDSKSTLVNELYIDLKAGMGAAVTAGLPTDAAIRDQVHYLWTRWMTWATSFPEKRRALAQLDVADNITAETHEKVSLGFRDLAALLERARSGGPMDDQPLGFVLGLSTAIIESTADAMIREPENAAGHSAAGFDAMWRVLASPSRMEATETL